MSTLTERLVAVQEKVSRLVGDHKELRGKVNDLDTKAREYHRMSEVLRVRVAELEKENEVLRKGRTASGGMGDPGTKEKIDELVQEIDSCLALLKS